MDNNFSAQVKEIISYSREEALRLGNDFIGTEHLVLGLIRDGENTAIKILKAFNVDLYELRKEIELAVKDKTGKNIDKYEGLATDGLKQIELKQYNSFLKTAPHIREVLKLCIVFYGKQFVYKSSIENRWVR